MPSIVVTMGGNSQSNNSKEDDVKDAETLEDNPVPSSMTQDVCSQDDEKDEDAGTQLKRRWSAKKLHRVKRSCPSRYKKSPVLTYENSEQETVSIPIQNTPITSECYKKSSILAYENSEQESVSIPIQNTPVTSESYKEIDEMDYDELYSATKPIPRRYFYKSRCKSISKYWQSVERYCRAITKGDIKFLNQLIAKHEHSESMCYSIPPLGEHYSLRWAMKDLTDEQLTSNPNRSRQRASLPSPSSALSLLKKGSNSCNESLDSEVKSNSLHSFLTENFNELLEECGEQSNSEKLLHDSSEFQPDSEISDSCDSLLPIQLSQENIAMLCNGSTSMDTDNLSLENRLKRDLEGIGIISHRNNEEHVDDEIVTEMKRCVAQMNALGANNLKHLKRCLKLAESEMKRQEIKQKLRFCDSEIVAVHQKIQASKLNRVPVTKRDRDRAWKLLKTREALVKELD